jgi:hypothetical protein
MKIKALSTGNSNPAHQSGGYSKTFNTMFSLVLLLAVFTAGCKKDATTPTPNPDLALASNQAANTAIINDVDPVPVNLRTAINFTILAKTGISTTGTTSIKGDIGVSPIAATAITGFGLKMDASNEFSTTPIVIGKVYAANYTPPTPSKMTTAINDMNAAFNGASGRTYPAPIVNKFAGNISGRVLPPGLYKYSTGVLISDVGVTLNGLADDVWVFQIAQNLTVNNGAIIHLVGGAQAKNIFWVVSGKASLGTTVNFSGNILSKTLISLNTGARVKGRLLAQTAVTLIASTVVPN